MKRNNTLLAGLLLTLGLVLSISYRSAAQNEVVRETRDVPSFNQIDVGGAFEVDLTQGSPQKVEVEAKQKYLGDISTKVEGNTLKISSKGINSNTPLNIYITTPELSRLEVHGAAEVDASNTFTGSELEIIVSGAAEVDMEIAVETLVTDVSGAADLELTGTVTNHTTNVSGAASLEASELRAVYTGADVSGAGSAHINSEDLVGNTSGAGEIYDQDGMVEEADWDEGDFIVEEDEDSDTTYIKVPGVAVVVTEGDDWDTVMVGNLVLVVDEDGDVEFKRCDRPRFNGDWAGFGIGFNGYVNSDFNMSFPKQYSYLDLRMEKSVVVNLNFFEQNIRLAKNQHWGIVTGLGFTFNNYRFHQQTRLSMDSSMLIGYIDKNISIRKSKLTAMYLTLPVLFEYQIAPAYHKDGFHISAGVIIGARLTSHTKTYYNELNTEFQVYAYDPVSDDFTHLAFNAMSPDDPKTHHYGDWYLQPFKFDATARIGWNFLNFWATYSLNTMFRKDKGPELYPWSAGITIVAF